MDNECTAKNIGGNMKPKGYFYCFDSFIDFDDGEIEFETQELGEKIRLDKNKTKQFFLSMYVYYLSEKDLFFKDLFKESE